jgi:UDP-N-acetylmuramyl pentapeptide phosphotransferase/UDP-N-acetylglucosamine-1-phosphate transferase
MNGSEYILPFLLSFSVACVLLMLLIYRSRGGDGAERREDGRRHKSVSRFGGIALIISFILAVLLDAHLSMSSQLLGLLLGAFLILFVGAWDDIVPVPWWAQLAFQVVLAIIIFASGMRAWVITNPFGGPIFLHPETAFLPSFIVGFLFIVLVMNAVNWADGADGLLGGVAVVAFLAIASVSLRPEVNQPTVAILAAILAGLSVAFLVFNFPPARIIAGTTGAYFIGFAIAALALFAGAKIATTLLVLAVPALDALLVIVSRFRAGVSPWKGGDERHLHDRLRRIGWSDRSIMLLSTGVSACAAFAALSLPAYGKLFFLLALAAGLVFFLSKIEKTVRKEFQ